MTWRSKSKEGKEVGETEARNKGGRDGRGDGERVTEDSRERKARDRKRWRRELQA